MELTQQQQSELAALHAELHQAEARIVSALSAVPDGHPLEDVSKANFDEANQEISELRARIKEIEAPNAASGTTAPS